MDALTQAVQTVTLSEEFFIAATAALKATDEDQRARANAEAARLARDLPRDEVERLVRRAARFADGVRVLR
jgi:hypothetical protein